MNSVTSVIIETMPSRKYHCVVCNAISIVSGRYLNFDYVMATCCSFSCYHKTHLSNTQEGFELQI